MSKKKPAPKPVKLELQLPPGETEITIGGEDFSVKVRSNAPLTEAVQQSLSLYRACAPQPARKTSIGFAGPGAGTSEISGPTAQSLYPLDLD